MAVHIHIDRLLVERGMSVGDFADAIGITPTNVAVPKNGRARCALLRTRRHLPGARMPTRRHPELGR